MTKMLNRTSAIGFLVVTLALAVSALGEASPSDSTVYPITGDPPLFPETAKLTASDGVEEDQFGVSVALAGNTAVVGANLADAAYIFERDADGANPWGEVAKLTASDAGNLGSSVAIFGDTAVAGGFGSIEAYIFERDQGGAGAWGEVTRLEVAGTPFGNFPRVAISGNTVVVGGPFVDAGGPDRGTAYIFERDEGSGMWSEVTQLTPSDAANNDTFGYAVAISNDTVLVAARGSDSGGSDRGALYVFERDQGGADMWGEVAKLTASDGEDGDRLGDEVAISGQTVVVGSLAAEAAYLFERDPGDASVWNEIAKLTASDATAGDSFGGSVAISGDKAVIGASHVDDKGSNSGAAYIFQRAASVWNEVVKLTASDAAAEDFFGASAAASANTVLVGATQSRIIATPGPGAAYVFQPVIDSVVEIPTLKPAGLAGLILLLVLASLKLLRGSRRSM